MSDTDGKETSPYKFTIKNNGNVAANFVLKLSDDQTVINSEGCTDNLISRDNIKIDISGSNSSSKYIVNFIQ